MPEFDAVWSVDLGASLPVQKVKTPFRRLHVEPGPAYGPYDYGGAYHWGPAYWYNPGYRRVRFAGVSAEAMRGYVARPVVVFRARSPIRFVAR